MRRTAYKTFGRQFDPSALAGFMNARGITIYGLAFEVGGSQQTVRKWLASSATPRPGTLLMICSVLKCRLDDLAPKVVAAPSIPAPRIHDRRDKPARAAYFQKGRA